MSFSFDAVFYYVSDLDRAIAFYEKVLGLNLISRDAVARFDVNGVLFELVPTGDANHLSGRGNARLCLRVEDIDQSIRQLRAKGVPCTNSEKKPGGVLCFFHDPEGNEICLWQYH
jgi:catechol 2,3-dioxygenase-like lactoylglutathione lyase family enzyme